ncbi:hypothetical protein FNU79_12685 [Deinococcus detaillensis]|uniref:Pappalysin-1 SD scarf domain-containing protein n=1 Tax=Deinococcus detaillensis TaxID=2592048 RepID=A0A553USK7_9DEIO|nr:hypothetical protein [Deinococcus detaillensis]TSA83173.1 hypothetical protein FNU79_12685 [Deinococcus detaillensis]
MNRLVIPVVLLSSMLTQFAFAQSGLLKQWASAVVTRSSEYGADNWGAKQALGEPNTMTYGDNGTAWASATRNGVPQSITVSFKQPVYASAVLVRETYGNGFVTKIFAIDPQGGVHQVWAGQDKTQPNYTVNFIATFPKTTYLVKAVKVVIDPNHDQNAYEEIDAIQLHGSLE